MATPHVLTIAQQKGGAGKTTLAAHLGVQWHLMGYRVAMIDIDPQGSLTCWFAEREKRFGKGSTGVHVFQTSGWRVGSEIQRLKREYDLVIVDSPPHMETEARTAIRHADLLIVPVQPSPMDLWATRGTLQLASSERIPVKIVLNRVLYNSKIASLIASGLPGITQGLIGNRVLFASSMLSGMTAGEIKPSSTAAEEVQILAEEIVALLEKRRIVNSRQRESVPA